MDETRRSEKPSPYAKANFISRLCFNWLNNLIKLGNRKILDVEDLYDPIDELTTQSCTIQLEKSWNIELEKRKKNLKPNLVLACYRVHAFRVFMYSLISVINEILMFVQPVLIVNLIKYFDHQIELKEALIYCGLISTAILFTNFSHHIKFLGLQSEGMKLRLGLKGLIYKKIFRLNLRDEKNLKLVGNIINLISNDVYNMEMFFTFNIFIFVYPVLIAASFYMIVAKLDVDALWAAPLVILCLFLSSFLAKKNLKFKKRCASVTDNRLDLITEVLNGIKIIKFYCWEFSFEKIVDKLRRKELNWMGKQYISLGFQLLCEFDLLSVVVFLCVFSFIHYHPHLPLTSSYVVYVLSYYSIFCKKASNLTGFAFKFTTNGYVGLKRVQKFLLTDEMRVNDQVNMSYSECPLIHLETFCGGWTEKNDGFRLENINFRVEDNELVAIVGSFGSGKSSFLHAILGELSFANGNRRVEGTVFYVPQEAWIFSGSIRQNILFGKPYDPKKFNKIIKLSCLDEDLKMFDRRERTMIGEKGINLSGGQRARINLARALYSDAQIYLFDDPLSAVDANVAKNLYENCLNGYLKSKIRVLVTHQIQYLSNVKNIYLMKEGKLSRVDNFDELYELQNGENETKTIRSNRKDHETDSAKSLSISIASLFMSSKSIENYKSQELLNTPAPEYNEYQSSGSVRWHLYYEYFTSGFGLFGGILIALIFFGSQFLFTFGGYWLGQWSSQETTLFSNLTNPSNLTQLETEEFKSERFFYATVFSIITGSMICLAILRFVLFFANVLTSLKNFHSQMFNRIISAPMRFFDINPIGRIMNRFSKDVGNVDDHLSWMMLEFIVLSLHIFGLLIFSVVENYWVACILVPLFAIIFFMRKYYMAATIEIKRIESIYRSPIVSHVTNTINGIVSIRSQKYEKTLVDEFASIVDYHSRSFFTNMAIQRWFGLRLDLLLTSYIVFVAFSCCLFRDTLNLNAGIVGIILVQVLNIIDIFQWTVRLTCEVENMMTSLERIKEYMMIERESLDSGKSKPANEWPNSGRIEFRNVSFKYDPVLPNVLENLTFSIESGEKIGIVGRTGAGKSSLIQALFRMAESEGDILIDDLPIKNLSLHDLRSRLSIIPQEPTLFAGTIRSNLDPLNEFSDEILWDSLEQVQLKETVKEMKDGLESEVHKAGCNLSVGQKQLICLARAIVRKCKILVIDEATANIDFQNDQLIQTSIRNCFRDCTVLTIAHRLNTIIDSDRILCLNHGKLENFGSPYELVNDKTSILSSILNALDKSEREKLIEIAKSCWISKTTKIN